MSSPSPALPPATPSRPSSPAGGFRRSRRRRRGAGGTHDRAVPSPLPTREGPAAPGGRRVRRGGERVCGRTAKPRRLHPFGLREEETPNPKSWSGRTKKKKRATPGAGWRGAGRWARGCGLRRARRTPPRARRSSPFLAGRPRRCRARRRQEEPGAPNAHCRRGGPGDRRGARSQVTAAVTATAAAARAHPPPVPAAPRSLRGSPRSRPSSAHNSGGRGGGSRPRARHGEAGEEGMRQQALPEEQLAAAVHRGRGGAR